MSQTVEQRRAVQLVYRQAHRAEAIARAKAWKKANPDRKRQANAAWQAAHPDYLVRYAATHSAEAVERERRWKSDHPERARRLARTASHRRRARQRGGEVEQFDDLEIFERDDWTCGVCGQSIDRALAWPDLGSPSLDHIIAIVNGGGHTRSNAQASHLGCNLRKGTQ